MGIGIGMIGLGLLLFFIGLILFMATSEKKKRQMEWKMNEQY